MVFGIFIIVDQIFLVPDNILPEFELLDFTSEEFWMLIALIVFFLSWFLFFLGVKLKGL